MNNNNLIICIVCIATIICLFLPLNFQGKIRGKKLQSLVTGLSPETHLGPYGGGSYTSASGLTVDLQLANLKELKPGVNDNRVVVGRVVGCLCLESELKL